MRSKRKWDNSGKLRDVVEHFTLSRLIAEFDLHAEPQIRLI